MLLFTTAVLLVFLNEHLCTPVQAARHHRPGNSRSDHGNINGGSMLSLFSKGLSSAAKGSVDLSKFLWERTKDLGHSIKDLLATDEGACYWAADGAARLRKLFFRWSPEGKAWEFGMLKAFLPCL